MPKLSIITINYNNALGLKKTIGSVFSQDFAEYEYIVIDGGSTDGSKEVIENHADKLAYWVSEKDKGIYNAMNKGVGKASGEYLLFLNSGDYFIKKEVLSNIMYLIGGSDIIYGNLIIKEAHQEWLKEYPSKLTFNYFYNDSIPHSGAAFIKHELFRKIGYYDETLTITSDWKFYMKALFIYNASYKYINETISVFPYDGISSKFENRSLLQQEKQIILNNEFAFIVKLLEELKNEKDKNNLLTNSRVIKAYFSIKAFFLNSESASK